MLNNSDRAEQVWGRHVTVREESHLLWQVNKRSSWSNVLNETSNQGFTVLAITKLSMVPSVRTDIKTLCSVTFRPLISCIVYLWFLPVLNKIAFHFPTYVLLIFLVSHNLYRAFYVSQCTPSLYPFVLDFLFLNTFA